MSVQFTACEEYFMTETHSDSKSIIHFALPLRNKAKKKPQKTQNHRITGSCREQKK